MKATYVLLVTLAAASLGACGGGDSDMPPPVSSTPPAPAATDFNTYAVGLAKQQDAASEKAAPATIDGQSFVFNDSDAAFASVVFPAN